MFKVNSFGLHQDVSGVWWLHQQEGAQNAVGLREESPFHVAEKKCNHQIDLERPPPNPAEWSVFESLLKEPDQLLALMLPIPRRGSGIFSAYTDPKQVEMLSLMSSPIAPITAPLWALNKKEIYVDLQKTNIQPLVVYGLGQEDYVFIRDAASYASTSPRQLLILPKEHFPLPLSCCTLKARSHYPELDWPSIGAEVIRRFARGAFPVR